MPAWTGPHQIGCGHSRSLTPIWPNTPILWGLRGEIYLGTGKSGNRSNQEKSCVATRGKFYRAFSVCWSDVRCGDCELSIARETHSGLPRGPQRPGTRRRERRAPRVAPSRPAKAGSTRPPNAAPDRLPGSGGAGWRQQCRWRCAAFDCGGAARHDPFMFGRV